MKLSKFGDYEKVITLPVFSNYRVHIIFTDDIPQSAKDRYGTNRKLENCDGAHHFDDSGHSHLFYKVKSKEKISTSVNTLVHEAYHAVYNMLTNWAGIEIMDEELVAYHLGYIVEQIDKFHKEILDLRKKTYESK